mmetsp:Transcript_99803/g.172008  ORF Transcript_99803/g.172008 Transcript_99803/m.172008 type:complete len:217 (+) Transcript_99803:3218-3868(+)
MMLQLRLVMLPALLLPLQETCLDRRPRCLSSPAALDEDGRLALELALEGGRAGQPLRLEVPPGPDDGAPVPPEFLNEAGAAHAQAPPAELSGVVATTDPGLDHKRSLRLLLLQEEPRAVRPLRCQRLLHRLALGVGPPDRLNAAGCAVGEALDVAVAVVREVGPRQIPSGQGLDPGGVGMDQCFDVGPVGSEQPPNIRTPPQGLYPHCTLSLDDGL